MTAFDDLVEKLRKRRSEHDPFPEDLDAFLQDFIPNKLLKEETFQKAFEVDEEQMEKLYREGYFLYQKELYNDAVHRFRALVILNPFRPSYWLGLGGALQLSGEFEKALHAYGVIVHLSPEDPAPHRHAYECYTALGNQEEAQKAFEEMEHLTAVGTC